VRPTPALPFYAAFDRSVAGRPGTAAALHDALHRLFDALGDDHDAAALAQLAFVALGPPTQVLVPLSPVDPRPLLPLRPVAATEAAGADGLTDVRALIADDVPALWARGRAVARPVVFLLTGDERPAPVTSSAPVGRGPLAVAWPRVVVTGLPADRDAGRNEAAVRRWATQVAQTVLASARSAATGGPTPVFPPAVRALPVTGLLVRP
jgi:hypothetical protein